MSLGKLSAIVHNSIGSYFGWHGGFVSTRPWIVIATCVVLSALLSSAYFAIMEKEMDVKKLFTPSNAKAFDDKIIYEEFYGVQPSQTRIFFTRNVDLDNERDCSKRSLMTNKEETRIFMMELFSLFYSIREFTIERDQRFYSLEDLCVKSGENGHCKMLSVMSAWNYSMENLINDPDPISTLTYQAPESTGLQDRLDYLLGKVDEHEACPGNVEAFQMWIFLEYKPEKIGGAEYDPRVREWNHKLMQLLNDEWKSDHLRAYGTSLSSIDEETQNVLDRDKRLVYLSCAVVLVYCFIALFKNSLAHCKSHLTIVSFVSVMMAIYSAFGFCQLIGVKYNPSHTVLPFLLLGLGVDDTFVIMSAYHDTSPAISVRKRIEETARRAGSSILITSVTDFAAFMSGTFTVIRALRDFSIYAAFGILFDFIYQITFFLAFLALDARREHSRYDSSYEGESDLNLPRDDPINGNCSTETSRSTDGEEPLIIEGIGRKINLPDRRIIGSGFFTPTLPLTTRIAGKWLPQIILTPAGKILVLLIELGLVGLSIYGCTKVKMDFRYEEWFIPSGSYLDNAFKIQNAYFKGNQVPFHIITRETYPDAHFHNQAELKVLGEALRNDPYVSIDPPIYYWFEDFMKYQIQTQSSLNFTTSGELISSLSRFLDGPGMAYKDCVVFNEAKTKILSTKISGFTEGIDSGWSAVHTLDSIRDTANTAVPHLDPVAFSYTFLFYDGYRVISWETIRNVILAGVAVFGMTLILLADILASLSVLLMVTLTDVMLVGTMWVLDLTFNSVTCVCMVMAVGLAIDYSVHIAHSFLTAAGSRHQRAEIALMRIGGAVLNGAFTTGLAVVVMAAAQHYILQTFFKMLFAIVIWGLWHGLIFLPVVLSLIGPNER